MIRNIAIAALVLSACVLPAGAAGGRGGTDAARRLSGRHLRG